MRRILSGILIFTAVASATVIYDNIPAPLPPNVPSESYEATSSYEFGGLIQFAGYGESFPLLSATVAMSDWTYLSQWASAVNDTTITTTAFYVPMTLNLYNVNADDSPGTLIGSATVNAMIPWRPEPNPACGSGSTKWMAANGQCYNGSLSTVSFDLTGITVPGQIIYGLSFDTTNYGTPATGVAGPYDSLNFALSSSAPSVGSNPLPGTAYWETSWPGFYADAGAGGVGTFRQDTGWAPYSGAIEFTELPEPATYLLMGLAFAGIGLVRRRFR